MARARNIKPGLYKNEDLAECSVWARYIFPGLWMLADREGRLEDRPKRIKGELLPFDTVDVEPLLGELAEKKDAKGVPFILRYEIDGVRYIQISKFSKHQTPHYSEKSSAIPPPPFQENSKKSERVCKHNIPGELQEHSEIPPPIKRGSQPPDSLNPDSLNHESGKEGSSEPSANPRALSKPAARRKPAYDRWNGEVVATLPVVGNGTDEFPIRSDCVAELQSAYPAVDVLQTLREMRAWCIANPDRRKTPSGVLRFVNRWLAKEQNGG